MQPPEILDYRSSEDAKASEIHLRDLIWRLMLWQAIGGFVTFALLDLAAQKFGPIASYKDSLLLGAWFVVYVVGFSMATRNQRRFALGWILTFTGGLIVCLLEMVLVAYFLCAPLDRVVVGYR